MIMNGFHGTAKKGDEEDQNKVKSNQQNIVQQLSIFSLLVAMPPSRRRQVEEKK